MKRWSSFIPYFLAVVVLFTVVEFLRMRSCGSVCVRGVRCWWVE